MTLTAPSATSATTTGSAVPVSSTSAPAPAAPVDAVDSTDDSGKSHGHRHAHGGDHGHVRRALMEALGDLGMTATQGNDGHGQGNLKHDIAQFMHTLFRAVKDEAPASAGTAAGGPRAGFGAGLSALITDASQGKAPAALQSAFDRLAADLKPAPATVTTEPIGTTPATGDSVSTATTPPATTDPVVDTTAASTTASSAPATGLQALLSRLQQLLGYGAAPTASSPTTLGNTVNLTA